MTKEGAKRGTTARTVPRSLVGSAIAGKAGGSASTANLKSTVTRPARKGTAKATDGCEDGKKVVPVA